MYNKPGSRFLAVVLSASLAMGGVPAPAFARVPEVDVVEYDADEESPVIQETSFEDELIEEQVDLLEEDEPAGQDLLPDSDELLVQSDNQTAVESETDGGRPIALDEAGLNLRVQASSEPSQGTTATKSGLLGVGNPSIEELRSLYFSLPKISGSVWSSPADVDAYRAGTLSGSGLAFSEAYINLYRRAVNLDPITLDSTLNANAAQGALILARLNDLTHFPSTPAGVTDAQAEPGKQACATSNLSYSWGYANPLQMAIDGQMADEDDSNRDVVGHRRWLVRPEASTFGIGSATAEDGSVYSAVRVFGSNATYGAVQTNNSTDYDFVAWPPSGACLNDLFLVGTPWSVTLNPDRYQAPELSAVRVVVTRASDGASWTLDSADMASSSGEYLSVNTDGYGVNNCIIFDPGSATLGADAYRGRYEVRVTGIKTSSGQSASLSYAVTFDSARPDLGDGKTAVGSIANQTFCGSQIQPTPSVTYGGKLLKLGTDYTLSYRNSYAPGTATVVVSGVGDYQGTVTKTFTIVKAPSTISLAAQTKTYTGKTIAYSGKVTRSGSAGKVTYAYFSDAACTKAVAAANVKNAGTYYVKAILAADANHKAATSAAAKLTVSKAAQPMKLKAVKRTVKCAKVKKKAVTVAAPLKFTKKAQGTVTYAKVAKGSDKCLTVNKKTGKVTVKRGTKKGTYKVKIKVTAKGNKNYKAGSKTVICKVVVK